jgi:hypothetical protein
MKTSHICMLIGTILAAGCAAPAAEHGTDEANSTSGLLLVMDGDWETPAIPDGTSVEDYAVAFTIPDLRPASIYVVSRPRTLSEDAPTNALTISRSIDGGRTFTKVSTIPDAPWGAHIAVAPSDDRTVYVTAGGLSTGMSLLDAPGHLWVSTDGGEHFAASSAADAPVDLDVNPDNARHLVGATCSGVFRSLDGGATFSRIAGSPNLGGMCNRARLYRGTNDRNTFYALYGVGEGGSYVLKRSTNGAGSWEDVTEGQAMHGFAVHPKDARRVYVQDAERGWISSADGGKTWFPHNTTLAVGPDDELSNVAFDTFTHAEPRLYIVNNGVTKQWIPQNAPEGGRFIEALANPGAALDTLRFETLSLSAMDGSPSPVLMGITSARGDGPRRLKIARLDFVGG